jgi:hypothetical protein
LPLDVRAFGSPPLKQMTEDFMRAYKQTVDFWAEDFHKLGPDFSTLGQSTETS